MKKTHDVIVHKAAIPLMKDESLGMFIHEVRNAARAHIQQKFNLDDKKGSTYPVEIFNNKAVFKVIPDYDKPAKDDFHVALKFDRNDQTGQFTFSQTVKVKAVTSFVEDDGDVAAKTVDKSKNPFGLDHWAKEDSLFHGVL
jgi:hypothetical protein